MSVEPNTPKTPITNSPEVATPDAFDVQNTDLYVEPPSADATNDTDEADTSEIPVVLHTRAEVETSIARDKADAEARARYYRAEQRQQDEESNYQRLKHICRIIQLGFAVASAIFAVWLSAQLPPAASYEWPAFTWYLVLFVVSFAVAFTLPVLYMQAVIHQRKERRTLTPWRWMLKIEYSNVPASHIDRIRFLLSEITTKDGKVILENNIKGITRLTKWTLAGPISASIILVSLLTGLVAFTPLPEWIIVIGLAVSVVVIWVGTLTWRYHYKIVTNLQLINVSVPPVWLPFLDASVDPYPIESITASPAIDTIPGRGLGFGAVINKTKLQDGEDITVKYNGIPNHKDFATIIRTTAMARRDEINASAA